MAARDGIAFLFGGRANGRVETVGNGADYDFESAKWSAVPDWPFAAPYAPGVVAVGDDRFLVLGMPCPSQTEDEDSTVCGQNLAAAVFDSKTGEWSKVPAPNLGATGDRKKTAVVRGYGVVGGSALFWVIDDSNGTMAAYDLGKQTWEEVAFPIGFAIQDYQSKSNNDADPDGGASNEVCYVGGNLVAARISMAHKTVFSWNLSPELTWTAGTAIALPDLGQAVDVLQCSGSELLFMAAGANGPVVNFLSFLAPDSMSWTTLPTPPIHEFEPRLAAVRSKGTWLLWPTSGADALYLLSPGAKVWSTATHPINTPVQLLPLDEAVLARTSRSDATPLLALYGI